MARIHEGLVQPGYDYFGTHVRLSDLIFGEVSDTLLIVSLNVVMGLVKVLHSLFLHKVWFLRNSTKPSYTGTLSHLSVYVIESFSALIWRRMLEGHPWLWWIKVSFRIFECALIVVIKKFCSCGGLFLILLQAFCLFRVGILEHSVAYMINIRSALLNLRLGLHIVLIVVTYLDAVLTSHNTRLNGLPTVQVSHQLVLESGTCKLKLYKTESRFSKDH